ncbi:hypothetical protein IW262DRAFT_1510957 [Armillaria fumosa]|nr:hypothetical protein IW262DRAFT_1510957 [Armillaria fumosa]
MWPLILVWILMASFIALCTAQDLAPSISWKNPNITSSKDDRIRIASAALDKVISMLQPNGQFNDSLYGTPGRLYGQMAQFDRLTNQTKYRQTLKQGFALAESVNSDFSSTLLLNFGLNYGCAAARAYTAYQDPDFLDLAVTSWTTARRYTISKEQAASGTMDVKKFNLPLSCQGATLVGGTYWKTDSDEPKVASLVSGFFLTISALLAEATSNQTYLDAAIGSANFIQSYLLSPSNIVLDSVSSISNESCSVDSTVYSYNSGIFIEGLVVLADITRNAFTRTLLRSSIVAVATDTLWQGLDGIVATTTVGGHYIIADDQWSSTSNGDPLSSATVTPSAAVSSTKKSLAGAIVGSVVGGLAVLRVVTGSILLLHTRHRRRNNEKHSIWDKNSPRMLTPFMTTSITLPSEKSQEHKVIQAKYAGYPVTPSREEPSTPSRALSKDMVRRRIDMGTDSTASLGPAGASPPHALHTERREDMPTEELLRLFNERLQSGQWNGSDDELPPEYHEGRTT